MLGDNSNIGYGSLDCVRGPKEDPLPVQIRPFEENDYV